VLEALLADGGLKGDICDDRRSVWAAGPRRHRAGWRRRAGPGFRRGSRPSQGRITRSSHQDEPPPLRSTRACARATR
jgi:hypothetical protein